MRTIDLEKFLGKRVLIDINVYLKTKRAKPCFEERLIGTLLRVRSGSVVFDKEYLIIDGKDEITFWSVREIDQRQIVHIEETDNNMFMDLSNGSEAMILASMMD